jgi:hypothetical protein
MSSYESKLSALHQRRSETVALRETLSTSDNVASLNSQLRERLAFIAAKLDTWGVLSREDCKLLLFLLERSYRTLPLPGLS